MIPMSAEPTDLTGAPAHADGVEVAGQVKLDFARRDRVGFDEAVLCEWKSPAQIAHILKMGDEARLPLLLTRLSAEKCEALPEALRRRIGFDPVSRTGYFAARPHPQAGPEVAVVSAGTSDAPVAREAARTLAYFGVPTREIADVGVAGLWRVLERAEEIRAAPVVIVVAGMDGALPSVVAGLAPGAVIAAPTSVGYGASEGGRAALAACLSSCAPGLTVVNIDNGFGAACSALRILRTARTPLYASA